jgi:ABC-2 type transport system permease protein
VVAGVILAGVLFAFIKVGHFQIVNVQLDSPTERVPDAVRLLIFMMFFVPFALVSVVVGIYYSLDSLYADRRDRSVLFWKSLPLSDWETVLSKFVTAAAITPVIAMIVSVVTAFVLLTVVSIALAFGGHSSSLLWSQIPILQNMGLLVYVVIVNVLWCLPLTAWCMLASAWARRAVFLWAVVPIAAVIFLEYQVFGTRHFADQLSAEGGMELALKFSADVFSEEKGGLISGVGLSDFMTPGRFFASLELWSGLIVTGGLLAASVWMRRYREAT